MPSTAEVIKSLIEKHGGNKTVIANKLKETKLEGMEKMSSQRLGQYANGKMKPKGDFYKAWKQVYKEDIESMVETNVSNETNTDGRDPWTAVHKLIDAFTLNSQQHKAEVEDLRRDKEKLDKDKERLNNDKEFFKELLRSKFSGTDTTAHKTK